MSARVSAFSTPRGPGSERCRQPVPATMEPSVPRRILRCGEHLFHAGETYRNPYLVCSGYLESYYVHADGEEQILGLHGAGEVVGFDALFGASSSTSVKAIDTASVQVVRTREGLLGLSDYGPELCAVITAMHEEIQRFMRRLHIERHPSERRLAEFLTDFADRAERRGLSSTLLVLPVSRRLLARYLGLAPETLSRTFSSFQERGILRVESREVAILDRTALQTIADPGLNDPDHLDPDPRRLR